MLASAEAHTHSGAWLRRVCLSQIQEGDRGKHVVPLGEDDDKEQATGQLGDKHYRVLNLDKLSKRGRQLVRAVLLQMTRPHAETHEAGKCRSWTALCRRTTRITRSSFASTRSASSGEPRSNCSS